MNWFRSTDFVTSPSKVQMYKKNKECLEFLAKFEVASTFRCLRSGLILLNRIQAGLDD